MKAFIAGALVVGLSLATAQAQSEFCKLSSNGKTYDLTTLDAATYDGTIIGEGIYGPINVQFSWCEQTVSSALCNVTDYAMTVSTAEECIAPFSTFISPMAINEAGEITFQLWSPQAGAVGSGTIACDPAGTVSTANLTAPVFNDPIYEYTFKFSSKAACGV